jgi:Uma2 family endonuclease
MATLITDTSQLDLNGMYSYADYLLWRLNERVELIRGKIFKMSPSPSAVHQRISSRLHTRLGYYLLQKNSACEVFSAPFDVRMFDKKKSATANQDIFTVVQPDICVICDKNKIDKRGCLGAPDLIVEILSKGNSKKEVKTKFELYEENGVREYWVVYPYEHIIQQFVLNAAGKYELHGQFAEDETFHAFVFPDLNTDLSKIFDFEED